MNRSIDSPCNTIFYNMWDAQQTGTDNIKTATVKTVYDPSPAGFCVPSSNLIFYIAETVTWENFVADYTNQGRSLTASPNNIFFPASGYRHFWYDDRPGYLVDVGSSGFYWTSSPYSKVNARRFMFNLNYSYPSKDNWGSLRIQGFAIRPVAEE